MQDLKIPCFKGYSNEILMIIFTLVIFKRIKMKKILLLLLCILAVNLTNAQSRFGIISYTLPEGWYARHSGNDIELVKKGAENSGCKIILFQEVNNVVNGEKKYAELWALKTKTSNTKLQKTIPPVKTEDDEWVSFSGVKTIGKSTEGFYTLCDGSKTAMVLAESPDSSCTNEIDSILTSVIIPEKEIKTKTRTRKIRIAALKSLKGMVN
jgi:hypothetical protein